jgi:tetratricopeptide (TPR) repeat protein
VIKEDEQKSIKNKPTVSQGAYEWFARGLDLESQDPKKALSYYEKALAIDPDYTNALKQAGFLTAFVLNEFDLSYEYLQKALALYQADKNAHIVEIVQVYIYLAELYGYNGKNQGDKAMLYWENARKLVAEKELYNSKEYVWVLTGIGAVYHEKGNYEKALQYYFESLKICEKNQWLKTRENNWNYNNISVAYAAMNKLAQGFSYVERNLEMLKEIGLSQSKDYAISLAVKAQLSEMSKNQKDALELYQKAAQIYESQNLKNTADYARTLLSIGVLQYRMQQKAQGKDLLEKAKGIFESLGYQKNSEYLWLLEQLNAMNQSGADGKKREGKSGRESQTKERKTLFKR